MGPGGDARARSHRRYDDIRPRAVGLHYIQGDPRPMNSLSRILGGALLAVAVAGAAVAADPIFVLEDPKGDDRGFGPLEMPLNEEVRRGELDLVKLEAKPANGGTLFEATFAKNVREPGRRTIDAVGQTLDQMAKHGFYTFNLDIYIDKDGVAGSGSQVALPGRNVTIAPESAWEMAICLTPDPGVGKNVLRRILVRRASEELEKSTDETPDKRDLKRQAIERIESFVFFPDDIKVMGRRVRFFVPASFTNGPVSADWTYTVMVTGADFLPRTDQSARYLDSMVDRDNLYVLPIGAGRPQEYFGGGLENNIYQNAVVDIIAPAGTDQTTILSNFSRLDKRLAEVPGVKPAAGGK